MGRGQTARVLLGALVLGLILLGCAGAHPPKITPTFGPPSIRGVAYHGMWTSRDREERAVILDAIADAGIPWVRLDVAWDSLQPDSPDTFDPQGVAELDTRLQEIADRGLSTLVMLWWAPEWSSGTTDQNGLPGDAVDYARVAAWMVQKWPDEINALQVWNEPNLPEFFASTLVQDYVPLLKAAYSAVKAVRPELPVVTAAPANLDPQWYADFYDSEVMGSFDLLGAHPYPRTGDLPPTQCRGGPSTGCDLDWLVSFKSSQGDPESPIWVTEFGYSTHPDDPALADWQRGVTEQQQAAYTAQMLAYFSSIPQVAAAFVYRDRDFDDVNVHQNGFGLLRMDNSPKPVYDVITCWPVSRCEELGALR